jgi:phage baseplate assembly protein W
MDRLQCLQQLLLPQGNSNPIGIATTTFDEELRALVFRGIRATDSSASDSSDHLRLWAWRVLLGVVTARNTASGSVTWSVALHLVAAEAASVQKTSTAAISPS